MEFLILGIVLGLAAGFSPGPLLVLVISETMRHDVRSGVKVALAPMITDLPIVVAAVWVLSRLSGFHALLGVVALIGSLLVLHMGTRNFRVRGVQLNLPDGRSDSFRKGILVNALSPHPYLFWFSVGAPIMNRAMEKTPLGVFGFLGGFYICLIGSKIVLAVVTGKTKAFLNGMAYVWIMRFLGLLLCVLAGFLFRDGLRLLGVL